MNVYMLRHGKAGDRHKWDGPDELRPLSKRGHRQADAISEWFADESVEHIVTSPHVRCRETVDLLAHTKGLTLEFADALAEGGSLIDTLRLLEKYAANPSVLCSHGDVILNLLDHLMANGIDLGSNPRMEKGSIWVLDVDGMGVRGARYVPPPIV